MHWPGRQKKARELLNFNFLFGQRGKLQMSAELISRGGHEELISRGDHDRVTESQKSSSMDRTGGGSATTTPTVLFDSFSGDGGNMEAGFGDEEDYDDEVVDSSQQASGKTGFPNSQELFLTLDLEPVPPEPTQGCLPDLPGGEGTSGAADRPYRGSQEHLRHDDDSFQAHCTICCHKAMGCCCCVAMQYHITQHPGDIQ
ncbi:hypothetical protein UY3_10002 [Chelonia mydas]|uniref:Uncharacterized protein n=1 Tax=Chelonia mydas TaxID=8469 RepID=M7BBD5_CHEMY|nr:hypothetical protein UY3_10002 [Chelonia mydas]